MMPSFAYLLSFISELVPNSCLLAMDPCNYGNSFPIDFKINSDLLVAWEVVIAQGMKQDCQGPSLWVTT